MVEKGAQDGTTKRHLFGQRHHDSNGKEAPLVTEQLCEQLLCRDGHLQTREVYDELHGSHDAEGHECCPHEHVPASLLHIFATER